MQHFITHSPWNERIVIDRIQKMVGKMIGDSVEGSLHIDETEFPKQGISSVGVQRQTRRLRSTILKKLAPPHCDVTSGNVSRSYDATRAKGKLSKQSIKPGFQLVNRIIEDRRRYRLGSSIMRQSQVNLFALYSPVPARVRRRAQVGLCHGTGARWHSWLVD